MSFGEEDIRWDPQYFYVSMVRSFLDQIVTSPYSEVKPSETMTLIVLPSKPHPVSSKVGWIYKKKSKIDSRNIPYIRKASDMNIITIDLMAFSIFF